MTKPGGDPNATRPCRLCKTDVPRSDWPAQPNPIVCDKCARANQTLAGPARGGG